MGQLREEFYTTLKKVIESYNLGYGLEVKDHLHVRMRPPKTLSNTYVRLREVYDIPQKLLRGSEAIGILWGLSESCVMARV